MLTSQIRATRLVRGFAVTLGMALALVSLPWVEGTQAAESRPMTKPEALGPRIEKFDAQLRRIDGRIHVEVSARVLPDDAAPAVRPRASDLVLKANERVVKPAAYRFDERTGLLTLRLDASQYAELSQPLPPPHRFFPQNRGVTGCLLELKASNAQGRSAERKLSLPSPDRLLAHLLGDQGGRAFPAHPAWSDVGGAPGQAAPRIGLRLLRQVQPPSPVAGASEAEILGVRGGEIQLFVRGEAGGGRMAMSLADASRARPVPLPAEALLPLAAQLGDDTYVLGLDTSEPARGERLAVLEAAGGRRVMLPPVMRGAPAYWAARGGVTFMTGLSLGSVDWAGQHTLIATLATPPQRGDLAAGHLAVTEASPGRLLAVAAGSASNDGMSTTFLRSALVAAGQIREASWLLDPFGADHSFVEDLRAIAVGGRALAIVSLARADSHAITTRIFDLADDSGTPILEMGEPDKRGTAWFWGAALDDGKLYVGRGNGGIAVFQVEAAR